MAKRVVLVVVVLLLLGVLWIAGRWRTAPDAPSEVPPPETTQTPPAEVDLRGAPPSLAASPHNPNSSPSSATDPNPATGDYVVEVVIRDVAGEATVPNVKVVARWNEGIWTEQHDLRTVRHETSALAGADGRAVLHVVEKPAGPLDGFDVGRDWHLVRWHVEDRPTSRTIDAKTGAVTKIVLWVRRAFRLQGVIVGADGRPVPDVDINFVVPTQMAVGTAMGNMMSRGGPDGRFDLGPFADDPGAGFEASQREYLTQSSKITFRKAGFAVVVLDPRSVAMDARDRVTVTLGNGFTLAGVLLDATGHALPDAVVVIEYGDEFDRRRGTRTDASGRWRLERVTAGPATLVARAFAADAKVSRALTVGADDLDVRLVAEPIRLGHAPKTTKVMGLELAEVDDDLRAAYDVPDIIHVMILDPGADPARLGIGRLEKGYGIMTVGDETVRSVRDVVAALLKESNARNDRALGDKRVVYTFWDERSSGTNTQSLRTTKELLEDLKATLERLPPR